MRCTVRAAAQRARAERLAGARREQLAGAAPRPPAAHDRRYRHHPARDLQRAGAQHGLLRRRQRARADRGRARRSHAGLAQTRALVTTLPELPARLAAAGRQLSQLHELRTRSRLGAGVGRLHRARDLGARRHRELAARRRVAACSRARCSRARCRTQASSGRAAPLKSSSVSSRLLAVEPGADARRAGCSTRLVAKLLDAYRANATDDWRWFESTLTYDNAILPLALFAAYCVTGDRATLRDARESLEFLEEVCFDGDQPAARRQHRLAQPRRRKGRAPTSRPSTPPRSCLRFAARTRSPRIGTTCAACARRSRGSSAPTGLGVPLYDFATGGCRDGMGVIARQPEPRRREHDLLSHVAARDARTRRQASSSTTADQRAPAGAE